MTYDSWKLATPPEYDDDRPADCDLPDSHPNAGPAHHAGQEQVMPEWFKQVMDQCEALSLDSDIDKRILWDRVKVGIDRQLASAYTQVATGDVPVAELPDLVIRTLRGPL